MHHVHEFKIEIERELATSTLSQGKFLSSEEVKKRLCVFIRNKVEPHVAKHFKADMVRIKITDDCVSDKTKQLHRQLDKASKEAANWTMPPTIGVETSYACSTFVVQMTFKKPVNKRVFILRDSYDRFLRDYNKINTHTRQCYSITNIERD